MKRIFVPTSSATDWQRLLAKPILHWKKGASAMTSALSWEDAGDRLPPEISSILSASGDAALTDLELLAAIPEWQVELPGGTRNSCTDIMAICRNGAGLVVIGVEAKVLEDFGPMVSSKRAGASAGQTLRLAYLHELLGVAHFDDAIRYQLLHRTASALITARAFHASAAVMLVQAFNTPADRRADFDAFRVALDAVPTGAPMLYRAGRADTPALYLGWCDGDMKFLERHAASVM